MNPKIISSFLAGAALASGIVYFAAARSEPAPKAILISAVDQAAPETAQTRDDSADPGRTAMPQNESSRQARTKLSKRPPDADRASVDRTPVDRPDRSLSEKPSPMLSYRQETQQVVQAAPVPPASQVAQQPPAPKPEIRQPDPPQAPAPALETRQEENGSAAPAQPHSVTLTAGTALNVRVGETLSTKKSKPGDTFLATLSSPLVIDGFVIAERGARAEGRIVEADKAGKIKGNPLLVVELTRFTSSDGQNVRIRTAAYNQEGKSPTKTNAAKVAGGAALGAIIGAIAGGGKGAAIGSGVGGAAGAGDVALTKGPDAEIPVETRLTFRVQEPVTITEKLR